MISILVVGQTPPPYGGQAVMIDQLLKSEFSDVELHHVRMAFSDDMDSIGHFNIRKVSHLFVVICKIFFARIKHRPDTLYYPPAGPDKVPFLRDAAILFSCRWMFKRTIFHFHASGVSELYSRLGPVEKILFRRAYWKPDVAIRTSARNPDDGAFLDATTNVVIENGLPTVYPRFKSEIESRVSNKVTRLLYVGALYESKGISVLIEACRLLKAGGAQFGLFCLGRFESAAYEAKVKAAIKLGGLDGMVSFPGVLTGDEKWRAYARANVFCFPSYFESESFGLVNLEAMQFGLPVVSTRWRGIPSVVEDGKSGFLVDIKSPEQTAEQLLILLNDDSLRQKMGHRGREIFIARYADDMWRERMNKVLAGEMR